MFGLSLGHLLILTLVVLLFGHKRLPELGSALGQALAAFKKGMDHKDPGEQIADKSKDDRDPRA
ncbi:twin-arginine translocase TatA/TatE family subunit [bacterium]|nr:twin-arginine translocase TatA/TatE family subunit [bacterium]